jgi:hypothetical protein
MFTAIAGRRISFPARRSGLAVLGVLLAIVAGNASSGQVLLGPPPADPGAGVPPVEYRSTIAPFTSRRPVEPGPWRQENERVAPEPKAAPNPAPKPGQTELPR